MSKKNFDAQLRATIANEDQELKKRFEKVDSILRQGSLEVTRKTATSSGVVRDTFTMPPHDYALIEKSRTRGAHLGHIATKSDVIRAGLKALETLDDENFLGILNVLERVLPGRKSK